MLSLLLAFLIVPECMGYSLGWSEDKKVVCSGKDFQVPVYSRSRIVTFIPSSPPGPKRVLLENNMVTDPRYELTRDLTLLVRDITHRDQGLYSVKFAHGFTIETVELEVSECTKRFHKKYGDTFELYIQQEGTVLEFEPLHPVALPSSPSPPLLTSTSASASASISTSSPFSSSTASPPSSSSLSSAPSLSSSSPSSPPLPSSSSLSSSSLSPSPPPLGSSSTISTLPPSSSSLFPSPSSNSSNSSLPLSSNVPTLPLSISELLLKPTPPPPPPPPMRSSGALSAPRSSPTPLILWTKHRGSGNQWARGRMEDQYWVIDGVVPADQGNYTVKDSNGKVVSRISLQVSAHWSNLTLYNKESLHIPLRTSAMQADLRFTSVLSASQWRSITSSVTSRPPTTLLRDGQISQDDRSHHGHLSLDQNATGTYFVLEPLSEKDSGIYELRDAEGNLVSTHILRVVEKPIKWRAVMKSITVPSGMFATLAGFILFMKRYPSCSIAKILSCLRDRRDATTASTPPRVHIQDYGEPDLTDFTSSPYKIRSSKQWSASPLHTSGSPVVQRILEDSPRPRRGSDLLGSAGLNEPLLTLGSGVTRKTSFSLMGAADCLHSSEQCAQFEIDRSLAKHGAQTNYFSQLPLDTDTSTICSVYNSDKLDFLQKTT